jgi:hypothetical protein
LKERLDELRKSIKTPPEHQLTSTNKVIDCFIMAPVLSDLKSDQDPALQLNSKRGSKLRAKPRESSSDEHIQNEQPSSPGELDYLGGNTQNIACQSEATAFKHANKDDRQLHRGSRNRQRHFRKRKKEESQVGKKPICHLELPQPVDVYDCFE